MNIVSDGEPAVWSLPPDAQLTRDTRTFGALVTRLDCSGGVTGAVRAPVVTFEADRIIVTFTVDPLASTETTTCPSNNALAVTVSLDAQIGDRELVDGVCLPGARAFGTGSCLDHGIRWAP